MEGINQGLEQLFIAINDLCRHLVLYRNFVQGLRVQIQKLNSLRDHLHGQIRAAENNLQLILPHVKDWCRRVDELKQKADRILGDEPQDQNGASMHWTCPNLRLRYSLSREARELTADAVELQREYYVFGSHISYPAPPMGMNTIPATSYTLELDSRRYKEEEIMSCLRDNSIRMIGVWGMGGVGKTTMAKKIFEKASEEKLFDDIVMATVSQQVDVKKIQQELSEGLGLRLTGETVYIRARQLHSRLRDKNVLIVLDDVWQWLNLEEVGIPSQVKILLTTRDNQVCQMMSIEKATKILALEVLNEKEAFSLFRENVGSLLDQSNLQPLARDVAKECKGLPLALVVVGRSLRGETDESTWEESLRQLRKSASVNIPGYLRDVFKPLELSYKHLESDQVRYLFLLCCLFPEDSKIEIESLVRYGVGLSIFSAIESMNEIRKRVNYSVNVLIDRCLLMDAGGQPWPTYVKMHDVCRDMGLSIASTGEHVFMVNHDKGLRKWPGNDSGKDYTCISLTLGKAMAFQESISCPRLNSLLLTFDFDYSTATPKQPISFLNQIANLRLLSINNRQNIFGHVLSLSLSFLPSLKNLRALHLDECDLEDIYLIGQMVSLEILSCRESGIRELPNEIGALTKLKLLDLTDSGRLRNIAPGVISKLVQLEELRLMNCPIEWEVKEERKMRSNASLAEVFSLRNLKFLEIKIWDSEVIRQEMGCLQNLTSYYIMIGDVDSSFSLKGSYTDLKRIEVRVNERKVCLNANSMLLKDVEELSLQGNGSKDMIDPLARQGFQSMKHLTIAAMDSVKHLALGDDIFPILRHLELRHMRDLEEICHGPLSVGSFSRLQHFSLYDLGSLVYLWRSVSEELPLPNLEEIKIRSCKNLKWVFPLSIAKSLSRLQSIEVCDCPILEEVFKDERGSEIVVTTIKFPSLNKMILCRLPMLCALCKAVDVFEFPLMKTLRVEITEVSTNQVICPNLSHLDMRGLGMEIFYRDMQISRFTKLEQLKIMSFDSLRILFSLDVFRDLINLKKLIVQCCLMLEDIEEKENDDEGYRNRTSKMIIPKLQTLDLSWLPNIRYFWSFYNALELPSLEIVKIEDCGMMETFAMNLSCSSSMSSSSIPKFFLGKQVICPNLHSLELRKLKVCGQLFSHEIPIASLGVLRYLRIGSCHNLESLFTPRTFGGLTSLHWLRVDDCLTLEEVIAKEDVDDESGGEMAVAAVILPKLRHLTLEELPKLRGFSHMHSDLKLPSLERIIVCNCNEMKTTFSLGRGCVGMPKGVKVVGIEDSKFASKLFFKGEHHQDKDGSDNGCFMLHPSDLTFTWDSHNKPWVVKGSSDVFFPGGWRKVCGKFDTAKLSLAIVFEIVFVIMPQRSADLPEFDIILENDKRTVKMMDMPTDQGKEIVAGELRPSSCQGREITFSLQQNNVAGCIVLKGVSIRVKKIIG